MSNAHNEFGPSGESVEHLRPRDGHPRAHGEHVREGGEQGEHSHAHDGYSHERGGHSHERAGQSHEHSEHSHAHDGHAHTHGGRTHVHGPHTHSHGVRGVLRELLVPHSHDAADSIDDVLESSSAGIRAVKISLVVLGVTAAVQVAIVLLSGSVALAADTIHNVSDALTAVPLWIAFALGRRGATRRYTYGFGRAEDLAGLFVITVIALSALLAGYEAVRRLMHPLPLEHLWWVAAAGLVGFAGNEIVALYRIRVGRRIGSAALVADGLHARIDGLTSLAVLIGAGGVAVGFPLADPLVGLLITVAILGVLRTAARDVFARLMDAVDPALIATAERALAAEHGVLRVRSVRMRWLGHRLYADAELDIDPDTSLADAHRIAHEAEHTLAHAVPRLDRALVHAYPEHA
ncbi:cation diffusion facilitator family transporter [Nocardia vaccinii]|uniref:cation diffusion facilitator family transporter n=1 Tax=Nocardia vaccinii TaxID=1822 RepID=UPI000A004DC9|nr:cation diffusion facilitator family transporter [Nocardia vaccinii]